MSKIIKTIDGNEATAYVSYAFTEAAAIYPITPSSTMAELVDEWSSKGRENIFGKKVNVIEMQSEAGAAATVHGSLQTGTLTTTYTASQGLLLMIPNMYKMAGELLPAVFHVSARAIAAHALSIFGDHQDVMAARQTGFSMLCSNNPQEAMDMASVAHLSAIKGSLPFLHFFDGFRTSHEIQKIECIDYSDLESLLDKDALQGFRDRALSPDSPATRGTAQNPDIYFQGREASNKFYNNIPAIVEEYMDKIYDITGRKYNLFDYYGDSEADRVIIAMGSICDTIEETIDYLRSKGEKVGLIKVRLFRPFSTAHLLKAIPASVKKIAVLDRTKEPGSIGEPLFEDIRSALYDSDIRPVVVGGRYGLGSKDTTPGQILSVFKNLESDSPKKGFTIGIVDDVTNTSLESEIEIDVIGDSIKSCKFFGLGSDGTVGANKSTIKIIGDNTDLYAQGYFSYDSKKSGGVTISHLRFGTRQIKAPYLIINADFIACHQPSYIYKYDLLEGIKEGGVFLLNCPWDREKLERKLNTKIKRELARKNVKFYIINAASIAEEVGLGKRINMIMQTAFFKLSGIIPIEDAVSYLKDAVVKNYARKGEKIVNMNNTAIDMAVNSIEEVEVKKEWINLEDEVLEDKRPKFIKEILEPMNALNGDKLPVSAFNGIEDGTFPHGTAAYEKRYISKIVPKWIPENCIQCNQCAFVCPHAVIRPALLNEEESTNAPEGFKMKKAIGGKAFEGLNYSINVSVADCTGCNHCVTACPAKQKALVMESVESQMDEQNNFDYARELSKKDNPMLASTIKGSQFNQPLFEFSGACAGCGETPYIKLITQLFGDRMMIANATGCSSIFGASAPATPYTENSCGQGPAWANSLFEDNAEFGLGMHLGAETIRDRVKDKVESLRDSYSGDKAIIEAYLENFDNKANTRAVTDSLILLLESIINENKESKEIALDILKYKKYLVKRSQWMIGGDGWAYDIGYGGLDHVIASGNDVNILVLDTEVYSNTGGQSSKATPAAAIAQFAASGKKTGKKNLGLMAMSYGYVYVAQVALGADKNQLMKALVEAEKYNGPSIVIAYSPCINQGLKAGMEEGLDEAKRAVESGYWHLYRFNPELKEEGKNPFQLDSKEPIGDLKEFLMGEVRYASLFKINPDVADELFDKVKKDMDETYSLYKKISQL
ncbi:pyruvate:ferredoxin (flavodoxin) oxidoreductase [Clostridium sp.]|uniref:pyruvate:ferredoxin (flavodoxin) oxidoreductase n=1 Tax=Clostridium sp. TaxID=1506 RepID=UPI002FC8AAB1